jgi:leucyl aminopeptidase (aminopeptidase T)
MNRLEDIFVSVLDQCTDLKKEDVLIVTDAMYDRTVVEALRSATRRFGARSIVLTIDPNIVLADPIPRFLLAAMESANLVLLCASFLIPQHIRETAVRSGARLVSISGVDREIVKRCFDVNYDELSRTTRMLVEKYEAAKEVTFATNRGTELSVQLCGRKAGYLDGIARTAGKISVLPAGVVAVVPLEGTAKGTIVIDGSIAEIGIVKSPIRCVVENGMIVDIKGGREARMFKALLSRDSSTGCCVAEVGGGTNPKARYCGNLLEDERVYASGHVGFGRNSHIGGAIRSKIHIDSTMKRPKICIDGREVVSSGRIRLE